MSSFVQVPGLTVSPVYLVTRERFAEQVGVTVEVVNGWIARGYIPTVPVGRWRLVNLLILNKMLLDSDFNFQPPEEV